MTLLELRKHIRTVSGRFDLIAEDGVDLGIGVHINSGVRYLDRIADVNQTFGRKFVLAAADTYLITFPNARNIREVYIAAEGEARQQLKWVTFMELRALFPLYGTLQTGATPTHFTTALLRPVPDELTSQEVTNLDWVVDYMDVVTDGHYALNGVILSPKTDKEYMVEIVGEFYTNELLLDAEQNFWSVVHPELLTQATMLQLEITNRNTQGVNDAKNAIFDIMREINMDEVETEAYNIDQMGG